MNKETNDIIAAYVCKAALAEIESGHDDIENMVPIVRATDWLIFHDRTDLACEISNELYKHFTNDEISSLMEQHQ